MSLLHRISTASIPRQVSHRISRIISPNGKLHSFSPCLSTCQSYSYHSSPCNHSSSERVDRILDKILQLDTIEVHLLTELINEKMGIAPMSAAQRAAMSRQGGAGGKAASAEPVEEKKTFDVKLTGFDASSKIKVIKEIRAITGFGLKEAKEMVEGVPKVVKKDIKMEEAEEIKSKLEAIGATIEIA